MVTAIMSRICTAHENSVHSLCSSFVGKFVQGLRKKFQDELAAASSTAEESIGNIRTVRSFSQEHKSMNNYKTDIDKSYKVGAKLALASGMV